MRQQENLNFNDYEKRHPNFARLPWRQRLWLGEVFADIEEGCLSLLPAWTQADAVQRVALLEDLKCSLDRKHDIEENLLSLTFEKICLDKRQLTGVQQSVIMRELIYTEISETMERLMAAQLIARFYQNLKDNTSRLHLAPGPRLFMEVRRSRARSDEHIEGWIDQAEQSYGSGVADKLRASREDILEDYRGMLQQQAAGVTQAQVPALRRSSTYQSVLPEEASVQSEDDEMLFLLT